MASQTQGAGEETNAQTQRACEETNAQRGRLLLWTYAGLVLGWVALYFLLHSVIPADGASGAGREARDKFLAPIVRAEAIIAATKVHTEEALVDRKNQLAKEIGTLRTEAKNLNAGQAKVATLIAKFAEENEKPSPNTGVFGVYLSQLRDEVTGEDTEFFWSAGWLRWLEVFLWSLLGTFVYCLYEIQRWLLKKPVGEFVKGTPWYVYTTIKGPLVALLIMFALTNIKVEAANTGIDLSTSSPITLWIFLAGVLGLFARVAYEWLTQIVKAIMSKAWASARDPMEIKPPTVDVAFGKQFLFRAAPQQPLTWAIVPSDLGRIDSNGTYTAPARGTPPEAVVGAQVTVVASLKEEPSIVATAKVTLREESETQGADAA